MQKNNSVLTYSGHPFKQFRRPLAMARTYHMNHTIRFILFLLYICLSWSSRWKEVSDLSAWFDDYDRCVLQNPSRNDTDAIMAECENKMKSLGKSVKPLRCRVGNSWPSKSGMNQSLLYCTVI